jgi:hypothetical protein
MYHYATVSKALDELNEMGSPMILTAWTGYKKTRKNMRLTHLPLWRKYWSWRWSSRLWYQSNQEEKGVFVAGFAANSDSDAAQVLVNISIKTRIK